jgi:hypothetical protein
VGKRAVTKRGKKRAMFTLRRPGYMLGGQKQEQAELRSSTAQYLEFKMRAAQKRTFDVHTNHNRLPAGPVTQTSYVVH